VTIESQLSPVTHSQGGRSNVYRKHFQLAASGIPLKPRTRHQNSGSRSQEIQLGLWSQGKSALTLPGFRFASCLLRTASTYMPHRRSPRTSPPPEFYWLCTHFQHLRGPGPCRATGCGSTEPPDRGNSCRTSEILRRNEKSETVPNSGSNPHVLAPRLVRSI